MRIRRSGLALWKKWDVLMIFVRFCTLMGSGSLIGVGCERVITKSVVRRVGLVFIYNGG
jgi:hypothetical protein